MIKALIMIVTFLTLPNTIYAQKPLEKVSLQLQYLDQFQFAGYYMAKEKGFYKSAGVEVEIKPYNLNIIPIQEVLSGRADYSIGRSSMMVDIAKGKELVPLAAIFQSSPQILLATEKSGIHTLQDIIGKKVMITHDSLEGVTLQAMLNSQGIYNKNFKTIKHDYNLQNLIDGKVDVMSAYISNEPFSLKKRGIGPVIFHPKAYGFDFYEDILFTSKKEVASHPKRVSAVLQASLRGWEYAFSHIEESVDVILEKYNTQHKTKEALLYEARMLKKLALEGSVHIGEMRKEKWRRIYDIYKVLGAIKEELDIENMIYKAKNTKFFLSDEEKRYLKEKKSIKICVDPDWMPYEGIIDGRHAGISADIMHSVEKKIGVPLALVTTKSWDKSIEFAKKHVCDVLPLITDTPSRREFLHFTKPYIESAYVVATNMNRTFIDNEDALKGKKIAMVKNYGVGELLQKNYKDIIYVEVDSIQEALELVKQGEVFGYIDSAVTIRSAIEKYNYHDSIKISGKLDEKLKLAMGIRKDDNFLFNIMSKALASISEKEKETIINAKISDLHNKSIDYGMVWKMLLLFGVIISTMMMAYKKLSDTKEKLEESLNNFEVLLDSTRDIVVVYDRELNILLVNQAGIDNFGYQREEVAGLRVSDFLESDSEKIIKMIQENNTNVSFEVELKKKDGSLIPCLASGKNITYNGKPARVSTLTNLMEVKEAQQTLLDMNHSLEERVMQEVENSRQKDQQMIEQSRLAQMGEMISMIAHQWRQPLAAIAATGIDMKMSLMLDKYNLSDEKEREAYKVYTDDQLDNIEKFVQNLTETIDDFRNFYKPNKEREVLTINAPFEKSLAILKGSLDANGVEVQLSLKSQKVLPMFNNELMQVFLNILKNALDNFKEKGIKNPTIMIESKDSDSGVMISLCDNGGGIPQEVIKKIFDPYFSTKDEKNGTGLGLYMSKTIVEEHHDGKLSAQNRDDGVCFVIEIYG